MMADETSSKQGTGRKRMTNAQAFVCAMNSIFADRFDCEPTMLDPAEFEAVSDALACIGVDPTSSPAGSDA